MSDAKVIPVRVALRTRPLIQKELDEGSRECLGYVTEANQVIINGNKAFTFDYVFDPKVNQSTVYTKSIAPLIDGIFAGYNGTVLAYGQTGSGKTYTMGSAHCVSQTDVTDLTSGVIPRVIKDIFEGIKSRQNFEFLVKVSYVEIYKEDVQDLLCSSRSHQNLNIREKSDGSMQIIGLSEVLVSSPTETLEYMEVGNSARSTASTAMNSTSSRSHAIFTIVLESRSLNDPDEHTCSKFHLVDLAGSERIKRTKAQGDRLQEGIKINAGLLALGNVISALGEEHSHIPYRVSKLTRLLQDSLGGNSLTVMIACISPADSNVEETLNTLRYADRARKIKNKAVVNRDPQKAELVSLRKEVQQLRLKLLQTQGTTSCVEVAKDSPKTQEKLNKLETEKEQLLKEMQKLVDSNTEMCEKAITVEMIRDELCTKLEALQEEATKVTDDSHNISIMEQELPEEEQKEMLQRFRALRKHLLDMQVNENATTEEILANSISDSVCEQTLTTENKLLDETEAETDKTAKTEHILRTAKLTNQLQDLSKALAMKEELAKRMCSNEENMGAIKSEYEARLTKLDKELMDLHNERDGLALALEAAKKSSENKKLSEQRRLRLLELETQIKTLKAEKKEKEKVTKLKVQSDEKIKKLNKEIQSMKTNRVRLMKQIKEESTKYQQWKKVKEREVKQLKEKDRKRQFEIVRLERDFVKQKNVLRRKTEEAAASNKRLKEALSRQQNAAAKRQQSQSRTLDAGSTRMKAWLEEDIEIAVCAKQAKKHYDILVQDLKEVEGELDEVISTESPSKRRRTYTKNENDEVQRRRRELVEECELKKAQMKDLEGKLSAAKDTRNKQQQRLLQITSIAEARSMMKCLHNLVVSSRVEEDDVRTKKISLGTRLQEEQKRNRELEERIEDMMKEHELNITAVEHSNQDKVIFLTTQLNSNATQRPKDLNQSKREEDLASQVQIQAGLIQELLKKEEEYEQLKKEKEQAPTKKKYKKPVPIKEEDLIPSSDDEEEVSDYESDYIPTPILRKTRRRTNVHLPTEKRGCGCKTECAKKICKCKKNKLRCTEKCGCDKNKCKNLREDDASDTSNSTEPSTSLIIEENSLVQRVSRLFSHEVPAEESRKHSLDPEPEKSYTPKYFMSPLQEIDPNSSEDVPVPPLLAEDMKKFGQKKRKLYNYTPGDLLSN
ncbi:chromosome-associated kinesin KIF4 isoform X1 [Ciona intestinalis]